jgi:hypothetical protein
MEPIMAPFWRGPLVPGTQCTPMSLPEGYQGYSGWGPYWGSDEVPDGVPDEGPNRGVGR